MSHLRLLTLLLLGSITTLGYAQQHDDRTIEEEPRTKVAPRDSRFVLAGSVGLLPSFIGSGTVNGPIIQTAASYYLTPRLALGVTYGQSSATTAPFEDANGVKSYLTTDLRQVGLRLTGSIVRTGPFEMYGGLQLGYNGATTSQRHEFPANMQVESEAVYIAERANPFGEARSQLSATGYIGVSLEVLPHVHAMTELGNNLSLLAAGVEVRF